MTHGTPDQIRGSARGGMPETGREQARTALAAYDRHGDALFSLALLLCRDIDRAVDAVVATVTQAHTTLPDPLPEAELQRLAADLWLRCADLPHSGPPLPCPASLHEANRGGVSSDQEQALIRLVAYGQAAAHLGLSAPKTAARLRSVLRRGASLRSPRRV
ncbi:hypothetical protein [Streptomyces sp. NPDC060022]|uniref:hypothetical protein n=1 Tax=Streptomyces sp. NPDC060022 TaxID=3347039 RepID=UPI00369C9E0A